MSTTDIVPYEFAGAAGHAHVRCIPEKARKAVLDPAGDWTECIGKIGVCDWCCEEGVIVS